MQRGAAVGAVVAFLAIAAASRWRKRSLVPVSINFENVENVLPSSGLRRGGCIVIGVAG